MKSPISPVAPKFACFNFAVKVSAVNLLNSSNDIFTMVRYFILNNSKSSSNS